MEEKKYVLLEEEVLNLNDVFQLLNQVEIKGRENVMFMHQAMSLLQKIFQGLNNRGTEKDKVEEFLEKHEPKKDKKEE